MSKYQELVDEIKKAYEPGLTMPEAERLAGKFLFAMTIVSNDLKVSSLDARMRKSGQKALKAATYLAGIQGVEKKPSDVLLQAQVDSDKVVQAEQDKLDSAECDVEELERYYNIFKEAHLFFRQISKGSAF